MRSLHFFAKLILITIVLHVQNGYCEESNDHLLHSISSDGMDDIQAQLLNQLQLNLEKQDDKLDQKSTQQKPETDSRPKEKIDIPTNLANTVNQDNLNEISSNKKTLEDANNLNQIVFDPKLNEQINSFLNSSDTPAKQEIDGKENPPVNKTFEKIENDQLDFNIDDLNLSDELENLDIIGSQSVNIKSPTLNIDELKPLKASDQPKSDDQLKPTPKTDNPKTELVLNDLKPTKSENLDSSKAILSDSEKLIQNIQKNQSTILDQKNDEPKIQEINRDKSLPDKIQSIFGSSDSNDKNTNYLKPSQSMIQPSRPDKSFVERVDDSQHVKQKKIHSIKKIDKFGQKGKNCNTILSEIQNENEYEYKMYEYNKKASTLNNYKVVSMVPKFIENAHKNKNNAHLNRVYSHNDYTKTLFKAINDQELGAMERIFKILQKSDVVNKNGENTLSYAVKNRKYKVVRYLLKRGLDKNQKNQNGDDAMAIAIKNKDSEMISLLNKTVLE